MSIHFNMSVIDVFLFSCFIGIVLARTEAEIRTWFMEQGLLCASEHPVNEEELLLLDKHKIPDSKNAKCLIACVFKRADWMNDKGLFVEENAVKLAEEDHAGEPDKIEMAKKLFDLCKKVNDETFTGEDVQCDRAAVLAKCLIEHAPKMGFKIE